MIMSLHQRCKGIYCFVFLLFFSGSHWHQHWLWHDTFLFVHYLLNQWTDCLLTSRDISLGHTNKCWSDFCVLVFQEQLWWGDMFSMKPSLNLILIVYILQNIFLGCLHSLAFCWLCMFWYPVFQAVQLQQWVNWLPLVKGRRSQVGDAVVHLLSYFYICFVYVQGQIIRHPWWWRIWMCLNLVNVGGL